MKINIIKCRNCGVSFPGGWGGYMYALANDGRRVRCPHPGEYSTVEAVTGMDGDEARAAGRVGYNSYCMCFSCGHQFEIDLNCDIKQCPKCVALEVRSAKGALACECPHCHAGVFYEHDTGVRS